jgi:hypothetical protein
LLFPVVSPDLTLSVPTPGAAISTASFHWENPALLELLSTAATLMMDGYDAGYDFAVLPPFPAAATVKIPSLSNKDWK